jgi:hypothetical protein
LTAVAVAPISFGEVGTIDAARRHRADWPQVVGDVPPDYEAGRHEVPVEYRHPRTGQTVTADVVVVDEPFLPEPGGPMTIAVDPANPDAVVVPGDGDPVREIILLPLFAVGVAAAAAAARWWSIRRTDRLITSGQTAFAMIAVLHPDRWRRGRVRCSLYPLDGAAGSRPVCTFDALTTGGLPIAGPAFHVEVRGRPIPGGLLVARCGERIIRPIRRPLSKHGPPLPGAVDVAPPTLAPAAAPSAPSPVVASLPRCLGWFAPLCLAAVVLATAITVPRLIIGSRNDARLAERGHEVLAEVTAKDGQHLTIEYRLPGSESTIREAQVNGSHDRVIGRRYPAHADDDGNARLDADPYNAVGPVGWLVTAWILTALVTWPGIRWWRDARRAARRGPWYAASGRGDDGLLLLAPPDGPGESYTTTCATSPRAPATPTPLLVAGSLEPGDAVAIAGPYRSAGRGSAFDQLRPTRLDSRLSKL